MAKKTENEMNEDLLKFVVWFIIVGAGALLVLGIVWAFRLLDAIISYIYSLI